MSATRMLVAFFLSVSGRSTPSLPTGLAAPMLLPGAIAAAWPARVMKVPAEPACAPVGAT